MARVGGGCCLLSPDVMRLGPRRGGFSPGMTTPFPSLQIRTDVPEWATLDKCLAAHVLRRAARFSVASHILWFFSQVHVFYQPFERQFSSRLGSGSGSSNDK